MESPLNRTCLRQDGCGRPSRKAYLAMYFINSNSSFPVCVPAPVAEHLSASVLAQEAGGGQAETHRQAA